MVRKVDSLVFNGISYGLDGTKKELKAGSDYTVKQSGGEGSWKEYTYTIKKENFEKGYDTSVHSGMCSWNYSDGYGTSTATWT